MLLVLAGSALAQNPDAELLFNEGVRLEAAGKLGEACEAFDASNKIEPRAGTMIRLGDCREAEGKLASAWSAFKDSLTRAQDPKKREYAVRKVAELEPRLSYLTVSVPDDSRVDGLVVTRNGRVLEPVLWNRAAPVDGGSYIVAGSAPGHESWNTTVEVPVSGGKASVEVPRFKELRKLVEPASPRPAPVTVQAAPSPFTPRRQIALGIAGTGVAAFILGITFGVQANGLESDAYALCPDPTVGCDDADQAESLLSRGSGRATLANVTLGAAGALVIGAAVLWVTGAPRESATSVSASADRQGARLDVMVRF